MTITQLKNATLAFLGIATAIGFGLYIGQIDPVTGYPEPITVDGQTITFTYTDSAVGENMPIYTNNQVYENGFSHAEVYLAIPNKTGKPQDTILTAYFRDNSKYIESVQVLTQFTEVVQTPIMTEQCTQVASGTECMQVQTGTSTENIPRVKWSAPLELVTQAPTKPTTKRISNIDRKEEIANFVSDRKSNAWNIKAGEVLYYKVTVKFPPNQQDEFLFDVTGNDNGKGFLR